MIYTKEIEIGGRRLVRTYSDKWMIRKVENGVIYTEATDIIPCPFTYEETDIPLQFPELEDKVVALIRERYSINEELHVQRCRDTEPDAFQAYNDFCEECIRKAKEEV